MKLGVKNKKSVGLKQKFTGLQWKLGVKTKSIGLKPKVGGLQWKSGGL